MTAKTWLAMAAAATVLLSAVGTGPAGGAEPPVPAIDVQLWPDSAGGFSEIIVTAVYPAGTELPVKARIPLPDGAEIQWSGEILGGDPDTDPVRRFKTVKGTGGDAVEFTLEETLTAQYEAVHEPTAFDGATKSATLLWKQTVPADVVNMAVKTPAGAGDVKVDPAPLGTPQQNELGERLWVVKSLELKPGETANLSVSYRPAGVQDGSSGLSRINPWLLVAAIGLAIALVALFLVAGRRGHVVD